MRIGAMRHKVQVLYKTMTQNEIGEVESTLQTVMNLYAQMSFEKVDSSDSKFSDAWANRLVMKTRYSHSLMGYMNNKTEYKIQFQNQLYSIKSYENWNNLQTYFTIYLEKDI